MKKLTLEVEALSVESFEITPRGLGVGTVLGRESGSIQPDDSQNSACDTACGGTEYYTCQPTEYACVEHTDNADTCLGPTCFGVSCGPAGSCSQGCFV
ncbi:MAG TPA: hypothetical protein VF541_20005 [Longimicrobium sp.]|jgi:hypothetical protein